MNALTILTIAALCGSAMSQGSVTAAEFTNLSDYFIECQAQNLNGVNQFTECMQQLYDADQNGLVGISGQQLRRTAFCCVGGIYDPTACNDEDWNDILEADPHVKQRIKGSTFPLCYDVFGLHGEIFKMYEEPELGFRLNTELATADYHPEREGKYVGRVGIISGSDVIIIDLEGAVIHRKKEQDLQLPWKTQIFANLTNAQVHVRGDKMELEFPGIMNLGLEKMYTSYFDLNIHYYKDFSETATGIMGDVGSNVEIILEENEEMALLNLPDGTSPRFPTFFFEKRSCLKMKRGYDLLDQFILKNKVPCIMC